MCGYDQRADAELKAAGKRTFDGLAELSARLSAPNCDGWRDHAVACRITTNAFGVLPIGDGPNGLSDAETAALVPRVEGAADLVEALLSETESVTRQPLSSWLSRFRAAFRSN